MALPLAIARLARSEPEDRPRRSLVLPVLVAVIVFPLTLVLTLVGYAALDQAFQGAQTALLIAVGALAVAVGGLLLVVAVRAAGISPDRRWPPGVLLGLGCAVWVVELFPALAILTDDQIADWLYLPVVLGVAGALVGCALLLTRRHA